MRAVSDREIAVAVVLEFVETKQIVFGLLGFYDEDEEFLRGLAERLNVAYTTAYINKLRKVVRRLVNYGVLLSRMRGTAREYVDEPSKQQVYWLRPGKEDLIRAAGVEQERERRGLMTQEGEVSFLLRYAYPEPDYEPANTSYTTPSQVIPTQTEGALDQTVHRSPKRGRK